MLGVQLPTFQLDALVILRAKVDEIKLAPLTTELLLRVTTALMIQWSLSQ